LRTHSSDASRKIDYTRGVVHLTSVWPRVSAVRPIKRAVHVGALLRPQASSSPGSRTRYRSIWRKMDAARTRSCCTGTPANRSPNRSAIAGALAINAPLPSGEVATDYPAIAIKQRIGETVDVTVKRPRAGGGVHRCIVAEGVRPEQYERLWSESS
jgi:hypothetical protein